MKKTWFCVLVLFLLLSVTGCVTTSPKGESTPLSLYSTRRFALENQVFFIGEGQSESMRQAELLSLTDLNNKVYRYLGIDAEPESYRELSTNGTISAYGLKIQERSYYVNEGEYTFAVVAVADKDLLAKDRSTTMQKEEEIARQAMDLVLQGDEYIKANQDIDGLRCYLQSMELSYGLQYIDDEYSFASILEEVVHIIEVLQMDISNVDESNATCTIKISRHDTIIPSRVKNGTVKSTFSSSDSRGQTFVDWFMYTTNDRGIIKFVPRAYNIENSGTITIQFDFEDELEALEKLTPSTADMLRYAIEEKGVSFDYHIKHSGRNIAVCTQCVNVQGLTDFDSWVGSYLVDKYSQSGIEAMEYEYIEDEEEADIIERFKKDSQGAQTLVILRVGVNDVFSTRMNICSVGVEGTVVVYDLASDSIIYNSDITYANGFGSSVEEAQDIAFENYVLKMFELLKAYYV